MATTVDIAFPIRGRELPRDHGYSLYGALSRAIPGLHGAPWLGVQPLAGTPGAEGMLSLRDDAQLLLRLPAERIPDVLPLAGATLDVGGALFTMGAPRVFALRPAATLDARLVVIKLTDPPHRLNAELNRDALNVAGFADRYQAELKRQLAALDIHSPAELCGRASITVAGKRIVGYSVRVADLSADQSLRLQAAGLGGKRRMGCGMFRATRGA